MHEPPRARTDGGDGSGTDPADQGTDPEDVDEGWTPLAGLSDEGFLLLFAGSAAGLVAVTATTRDHPQPIAVFAAIAALVGFGAIVADLVGDYAPGRGVLLVVGGTTGLAAAFAVPGRYYVDVATLGVGALLVLYRVLDLELHGEE